MRINDMIIESHDRAIRKGFYELPPSIDQRIALIHSEISEAYEEIRANHPADVIYYKDGKPEGFPIEIADAVIRIFDMCSWLRIDLENAIRIKSDFNETRPLKHGKAF
jgi:NTP pyrophosphatase (non-canonical NTP hydrolase)